MPHLATIVNDVLRLAPDYRSVRAWPFAFIYLDVRKEGKLN